MTQLVVPVGKNDHILGDPKAPAILIEYGDFECPHCGEAFSVIKAVLNEERNKAKFVFRHFPLTEIHPHALHAAYAAEAASKQGKFWDMHDLLFINQNKLADEDLLRYAEELSLNLKKFTADMNSILVEEKVHQDFLSGVDSGVIGTPAFFINGESFDGPVEFDLLTSAIERAIDIHN